MSIGLKMAELELDEEDKEEEVVVVVVADRILLAAGDSATSDGDLLTFSLVLVAADNVKFLHKTSYTTQQNSHSLSNSHAFSPVTEDCTSSSRAAKVMPDSVRLYLIHDNRQTTQQLTITVMCEYLAGELHFLTRSFFKRLDRLYQAV